MPKQQTPRWTLGGRCRVTPLRRRARGPVTNPNTDVANDAVAEADIYTNVDTDIDTDTNTDPGGPVMHSFRWRLVCVQRSTNCVHIQGPVRHA